MSSPEQQSSGTRDAILQRLRGLDPADIEDLIVREKGASQAGDALMESKPGWSDHFSQWLP